MTVLYNMAFVNIIALHQDISCFYQPTFFVSLYTLVTITSVHWSMDAARVLGFFHELGNHFFFSPKLLLFRHLKSYTCYRISYYYEIYSFISVYSGWFEIKRVEDFYMCKLMKVNRVKVLVAAGLLLYVKIQLTFELQTCRCSLLTADRFRH